MNSMLPSSASEILDFLSDGIILCSLANYCRPGIVKNVVSKTGNLRYR